MSKRNALANRFALLVVGILLLTVSIVYGQSEPIPEGPDTLNITNSERGSENVGPTTVQAQAGNVSTINIFNQRLTEAWQGYYGNVSGSITLDDSDGSTFYDWDITSPQGEVYAANGTSTDWRSVYCVNTSMNEGSALFETALPVTRPDGSVQSLNTSNVELRYGINTTDLDGLNETYYQQYTDATGFQVAGRTFDTSDDCYMANPYENGAPTTNWEQLLLSDNDTIIFTALIREDGTNFKGGGGTADFQLMVLENGHSEAANSATDYYFYVELS